MQYQESQAIDQVTSSNQQLCPAQIEYPVQGSVQQSNVASLFSCQCFELGGFTMLHVALVLIRILYFFIQLTDSTHDVGNSNLSLHGRGIEVSQYPFPNALHERFVVFVFLCLNFKLFLHIFFKE